MSDKLTTAWAAWTADVNNPPLPDQDAATDHLQAEAAGITDAEGDAWFVAVATMYDGLGIIAQPTYVALRNEVNTSGAAASNDLFDALQARVQSLPETAIIESAYELEQLTEAELAIDGEITELELARDGAATAALATAYNEGVGALNGRKAELATLISQHPRTPPPGGATLQASVVALEAPQSLPSGLVTPPADGEEPDPDPGPAGRGDPGGPNG